MAETAVDKLAGRTEQEVAEDIASATSHFLYKRLVAIQNTYQEMGFGTDELGSIMYRVTGATRAALARRLERLA
jgi:hypothetical protein